MMLTRYEPCTMLNRMQGEINRAFASSLANREEDADLSTANWVPAVDVREEGGQYVIHADVPGLEAKNIDISMDKGILTIKGERDSESKTKEQGYRRVERVQGQFYRRFNLPDSANEQQVAAHYKNGVLEVIIPKKEPAKARRITVQ